MKEILHGFLFGVGFCGSLCVAKQIDSFLNDLSCKFWTWKRKNFE